LVSRPSRHRWLEVITLLTHLVGYVGLLVYLMGPGWALLVIVIHKAVGGV